MEPMRDLQQEQHKGNDQKPPEAVLAGWTLASYFTRVRIPVLAVVIAEMVLLIIVQHNSIVWLMDIALFTYLTVTTAGLTVRRAAILGGFAGLLAGLGIAIFRLVFIRAAYYILNLIAEPAITAIFGAAISAVLFQFIQQRQMKKKNPKQKKNGKDAPPQPPASASEK